MKKVYTILTSLMIGILLIHIIYMTLSVTNLITPNEELALNMGLTLMYSAILHGIYGMVKWVKTLFYKSKLLRQTGHRSNEKLSRAAMVTTLQRILGVIIMLIIIPHGYIKILSAEVLALIADIGYMIALIVHLWIGFPKWTVSLGLRPAKAKSDVKK